MIPFESTDSFLCVNSLFEIPHASYSSFPQNVNNLLLSSNLKGSIIHSLALNGQTSIRLPSDSGSHSGFQFPLHQRAQHIFKERNNNVLPDLILWLACDHNPELKKNSYTSSSRSKTISRKTDKVVLILDSDHEEEEKDANADEEEDSSSQVSWSDSDREEEDNACDKSSHRSKMVALLLRNSYLRTGNDGNETSQSLSPRIGDHVWVHGASIIREKIGDTTIISLVAVQDQTQLGVVSDTPNQSCSLITFSGYTRLPKKRPILVDAYKLDEMEVNCKTRKRLKKDIPTEGIIDVDNIEVSQAQEKTEHSASKQLTFKKSLLLHLHADRERELNPHDLLVRNRGNKSRSFLDRPLLSFFSNIWSDVSITAATSSHSRLHPPTNDTTLDSTNGSRDCQREKLTRHICRLIEVCSVTVRAKCHECENDYRNMNCVFYCRSNKWRIHTQMECIVNDGTAEVKLTVPEDREDIMWTLLGLMKKSETFNEISCNQSSTLQSGTIDHDDSSFINHTKYDPHQDTRNRLLRILARRGVLSFKPSPRSEINPQIPSQSIHMPGNSKYSATKLLPTHQEKLEDDFWNDICTSYSTRTQRSLDLYTLAKSPCDPENPTSQLVTGAAGVAELEKRSKLKTTILWLNRRTTIHTLVRPQCILKAIDVAWITPKLEANCLLDQLIVG